MRRCCQKSLDASRRWRWCEQIRTTVLQSQLSPCLRRVFGTSPLRRGLWRKKKLIMLSESTVRDCIDSRRSQPTTYLEVSLNLQLLHGITDVDEFRAKSIFWLRGKMSCFVSRPVQYSGKRGARRATGKGDQKRGGDYEKPQSRLWIQPRLMKTTILKSTVGDNSGQKQVGIG